MATTRIPLVLCIDVEPDDRAPERRPLAGWDGLESIFQLVDDLRPRIEEATGEPARFSWFLRMDPQIASLHGDAAWAAHRYATEFARLSAAGDAIGLHVHPWRWDGRQAAWINDLADADWVEECVRTSFAEYAATFGSECRIHRFGDHFMDQRTLAVVEECGARFDLTIEPGWRRVRLHETVGRSTGYLPDQSRAPRTPYRPSRHDHLQPGKDGDARNIWMLPLASTDTTPSIPLPRRIARRIRWPRRTPIRQVSLTHELPAETVWTWMERDLAAGIPCLTFAIRSDIPLRPHYLAPFEAKVAHLLAGPLAGRVQFVTPAAAIELVKRGLSGADDQRLRS